MKTNNICFVILCFVMLATSPAYSSNSNKTSQFQKWLKKSIHHLNDEGKVVSTSMGAIQVVTQGKGTPVLVLHGGFGGWDQGVLVGNNISEHGFELIIPSRAGYLSTPLTAFPLTAGQQADQMAALLDALGIQRAFVLGFSAGAPVAYEFGLRYPERTIGVVLESIGANPNEDAPFYLVLGLVLATQTELIDYGNYLLHLSLQGDFYSSAKEILPFDTNLTGGAYKVRSHYVFNHINQYAFFRQLVMSTIPLSPRLNGTLNDFAGIGYWNSFVPPGPSYTLPTLIIQAINDSNGYYPTAQLVNAGIPTSQLISVPESGHFIWLGPDTNHWEKQLIKFLKAQVN